MTATGQAADGEHATRLAVQIGTTLAQAARADGKTADAQEITAITEAIVRLLAGVPLRSDGQLTIKSLAHEAGLKRNKLTHKHTGMKDLFYALVRSRDIRPKTVEELQRDNAELQEKIKQLQSERRRLREATARFARIVHVLEVENAQLRGQAQPGGTIRPLPLEWSPRPTR